MAAFSTTSDSLKAQTLGIQAQRPDSVGDVPLWRTLNAGDQDCSSLGLLDVPMGTERIEVNVEFARSGLLYLAVGRWFGSGAVDTCHTEWRLASSSLSVKRS